ncbi:aromatic amino acid ammonia-lyase, partial [Flavobacteriales bacterium]|nr:aromatic amino acid ammonia-lyase [Flavobacteriales bacterium]
MFREKMTVSRLSSLLGSGKLEIADETLIAIDKSADYLLKKVKESKATIYGVNTGFGSLSNIRIEESDLEELQKNLILSHACGTGKRVPEDIVRAMLCLKVWNMLFGHSGVQKETVVRMIDLFNNDILPVVYTQGSLGASGD